MKGSHVTHAYTVYIVKIEHLLKEFKDSSSNKNVNYYKHLTIVVTLCIMRI